MEATAESKVKRGFRNGTTQWR